MLVTPFQPYGFYFEIEKLAIAARSSNDWYALSSGLSVWVGTANEQFILIVGV